MQFPLDQVEGVSKLLATDAIALKASARGGNLGALAEWTVWTLYQQFRRFRYSHEKAIKETKALLERVDLQPRIVE